MLKIFLSFILILGACTIFNDDTSNDLGKGQRYSYIAYNDKDQPVVRGWFTLNFDSTVISGKWQFEAIGNVHDVGPQVGSDSLSGQINGNRITVGLNPQFADNNVYLDGILNNQTISGKWEWVSFIGPTNSGKFEAEKY